MFLQGCGSKGTDGREKGNLPTGCRLFRGVLEAAEQASLAAEIARTIAVAPLDLPPIPRADKPFSVAMPHCGPHGWYSDEDGGWRYEPCHRVTDGLGRPSRRNASNCGGK